MQLINTNLYKPNPIVEHLYSFTNPQIYKQKNIQDPMQQKNPKQKVTVEIKPTKTQICRFYLRGLCINNAKDCYFSHGVWDLVYTPWTDGEQIIYDYSSLEKDCKEPVFKGERNYKILYEYQPEKIFTQAELNQDRDKRNLIRNQMHAEMFNDFMDLLTCYYPEALFTEQFLLRQFTRVGFNKTMSIIKLNHITSLICDPPSSRYFKISYHMPPYVSKETTFVLPCLSDEENLNFYKSCYEEYVEKSSEEELVQANIKKYLFGVPRPKINILPMNIYLKNRKMGFSAFLKLITNGNTAIVTEVDQKTLLIQSTKFIQDKVSNKQGWCTWSDVYKFIGQEFKINNANITNPLKPILIEDGFLFLNFPMLQFITSQERIKNWKFEEVNGIKSVCDCKFKDLYPEEELMLNLINFQTELTPKQSLDIFDMESLLRCAGTILSSEILAVDIEGRLRKNGYIEMIQINTGLNTFLIDIHRMLNNADMQTFQLTKKILRNAFCNPKIKKIFHDCRHDCLVLHEIMNTCVINIFDTSPVQTLIGQLEVYQNNHNKKQILKIVTNVKTPGLNDLLKKYNAPHGLNKNKQWFHQLWRKGHTELFEQRPLHPDYRQYCIKDVLDLPYLREQMLKNLSIQFTDWLSSHYVNEGYHYTVEEP